MFDDVLSGKKQYEIICGDCLDVMRKMPDGSVDALFADPPFGIGYKYATHDDTAEGYGEWMWKCIEMAESKCKPGSPVFVWQAMPNVRHFAEWFPREWRLFAAAKNFVQMRPKCPMQYSYDPVLVWWTPGDIWTAGTANRDWHIANTAPSARRGLADVRGHPCPRPLDLMRHIVNQWVRPGGVTLDPFMGSGTTGVACMQTGRQFIGIEIDAGYCEIAEKRIAEAAMQPQLMAF